MKLFTVIYNDARLLGHFLKHYKEAGVTQFFIATAPELVGEVAQFRLAYPIGIFDSLDVTDSLLAGSDAVTIMRTKCQSDNEWSLVVDLDEFVEFNEPADVVVAKAEEEGANAVRGVLYDRFSADGGLMPVAPDTELSRIFPVKSRFIKMIMKGCDHKIVLVRGHLPPVPGAGHHLFVDEWLCSELLEISHYKWICGAVERLRGSHRKIFAAKLPWEVEYRRALDHFDQHGRFAWKTFGGRLAEDFTPDVPPRCSDCPAPLSEAEQDFSMAHLGRPLCRRHQKAAGARSCIKGLPVMTGCR
jgi:hypothetical protein